MARPKKNTLEYITLDCVDRTTLKRLYRKFGKEGKLFWYELLRLIGRTESFIIDLSDEYDLEDILEGELMVSIEEGIEMLNALAEWGNIDEKTWKEHKNIWCQGLIDRHEDVFKKRNRFPENPYSPTVSAPKTRVSAPETTVSVTESTQSKVKESKVKKIESKVNKNKQKDFSEIPIQNDFENEVDFLREKIWDHTSWIDSFCMQKRISKEEFKKLVHEFLDHISLTEDYTTYKPDLFAGFKKHFTNYWKKRKENEIQHSKTNGNGTSDASDLIDRANRAASKLFGEAG